MSCSLRNLFFRYICKIKNPGAGDFYFFIRRVLTDVVQGRLPVYRDLNALLEAVCVLLESEQTEYRPKAFYAGLPGGLLDFSRCTRLPVIIVPDLHARVHFLASIFMYRPVLSGGRNSEKLTVMELLGRKEIFVVCLGDGFHSEIKKERWLDAHHDFENGLYTGNAMKQEMAESLALMQLVLRAKLSFPNQFHFLKGNHENILNDSSCGNHPFRKFVQEGEMVYRFMETYYGEDILHLFSWVEHLFPVCAVFPQCIVSHAEPAEAYSREQLINALSDDSVVEGLTWTDNGASWPGSVRSMLSALLPDSPGAVYFGGHRPVSGRYMMRQDGAFVQIHNPLLENIVLLQPEYTFNPERDIIPIPRWKQEKKRSHYE